jgi:hypothetical protein
MAFDFVGPDKVINISQGTTEIDVIDMYSNWKRWTLEADNLKYVDAMRSIGGEEIAPGKYIAGYIQLLNDWRIKPYDGNYVLTVVGNLFVEGGLNPFLQADDGSVLINMVSSSNALALENENCDTGIGFI